MSQALSVYGVKCNDENSSKTIELTLKPYVIYGENLKHYLPYLNKSVRVIVNDLAKSISVGITDKITLKPEENTTFNLKLVSSNMEEKVYVTIKENGKNIYLGALSEDFSELSDMLAVDYTSETQILGNNLFETEYTIYLSMNMAYYFAPFRI